MDRARSRADVWAPIQHLKVRPLRHKHHPVIAEDGGLADEFLFRQELLPPRTRITDQMEYQALDHTLAVM
jgi:hypothetical protein